MRKMMNSKAGKTKASRPSVLRGATLLLCSAVTAIGLTTVAASPGQAGTCLINGYICGTVVNDSGRTMQYATFQSNVPHVGCAVWNNSRPAAEIGYPWGGRQNCVQYTLDSGWHTGSGSDPDAFTMKNNQFDLFYNWHWRARLNAGIWVKILDWQTAICTRPIFGSTPNCNVYG